MGRKGEAGATVPESDREVPSDDPNEQQDIDEYGWSEPVVKIRDHNSDW